MQPLLLCFLTKRLEVFRGPIVVVGSTRLDQRLGGFAISVEPVRLAICAMRPPDPDPLVPVQPQPSQRLEDVRLELGSRSLLIGVVDAEDELTVVAPGEEPVEEGGPGVAHMQVPGG
jgi:hypothetical protein